MRQGLRTRLLVGEGGPGPPDPLGPSCPRLIPIEDRWARLLALRRAAWRAESTAEGRRRPQNAPTLPHLRHQGPLRCSPRPRDRQLAAGLPSQNQDQVDEYLDMFKTLNRITP